MMYKKLWWCILSSILVIFGFFFVNSFAFAGRSEANFVPEHWQTRWFVLDGWLNLVYLCDIAFIAYLWRPTANNRRFAMSEELSQEDDGFEIRSMADSFDDEEEGQAQGERTPMPNSGTGRGVSPEPAKSGYTRAPPAAPRESLDGETIFAVGEDGDRWSEDDDSPRNSGEGKRLTGKDV